MMMLMVLLSYYVVGNIILLPMYSLKIIYSNIFFLERTLNFSETFSVRIKGIPSTIINIRYKNSIVIFDRKIIGKVMRSRYFVNLNCPYFSPSRLIRYLNKFYFCFFSNWKLKNTYLPWW